MSHFLGTPARSHIWQGVATESRSIRNELDEAKNLRERLLSGPTVDIYVGPSRKHWSLHANLLCHHSTYFETEFQGHEVPKKQQQQQQQKDGDRRRDKLELPDDDPRGFELFVKWLYQGHLGTTDTMPDDETKYDYAVACHKLHLLASKFSMRALANRAMDAYRAALHETMLVPDAMEIDEIYRSSPPGSSFRTLMVRIAARQIMDPMSNRRNAEDYRRCFKESPDFAVEMVNAIRAMSGGMLFEDPTEGVGGCEWHDHGDGSSCATAAGVASGTRKGTAQQPHMDQANGGSRGPNQVPASPMATRSRILSQKQRTPMAELSSERRTPRKLVPNATVGGVQQQPSDAKSNGVCARPPVATQAGAAIPNGVGGAGSAKQPGSPANGAKEKKGHRRAATMAATESTSSSKAASVDSGGGGGGGEPRKLAPLPSSKRVSSAPANGGISKHVNGIPAQTPRKLLSHGNVNGIVRQLNGVSFDNDGANSNRSEGGRSQSVSLAGRSEGASSGHNSRNGRPKSQLQPQPPPKLKRKVPSG